jgi:hypothetical protein
MRASGPLLYTALDRGQRLDWFHSPLIFGLVASGALLIVAAIARHFLLPNPLVNYQFLMRKTTLLLTLAISDSFLLLATRCVACLVVVSFMSKVPSQYRQVTVPPVEVKRETDSMKGDKV